MTLLRAPLDVNTHVNAAEMIAASGLMAGQGRPKGSHVQFSI